MYYFLFFISCFLYYNYEKKLKIEYKKYKELEDEVKEYRKIKRKLNKCRLSREKIINILDNGIIKLKELRLKRKNKII